MKKRKGKASQTRQEEGSQKMEKWRLGLPKVTGNQRKDFLRMEHKIDRERLPAFFLH